MRQNCEAVLHFYITPRFYKAEKQAIDVTVNIQKSVVRNCGMWVAGKKKKPRMDEIITTTLHQKSA